jgi:hypothetical protein
VEVNADWGRRREQAANPVLRRTVVMPGMGSKWKTMPDVWAPAQREEEASGLHII